MQDPDSLKDYFSRSKIWYNEKYIKPINERSYVILAGIVAVFFAIITMIVTYQTMPVVIVSEYAIAFDSSKIDKQTTVKPADYISSNPQISIAQILLKNYVIQIEQYKYSELKNQLLFAYSTSSKSVFNQYYNFLNINNPLSPVFRLQDQATRSVEILSTNFDSDSSVVMKFRSISRDISKKIIEQMLWQANISFQIDRVVLGLPDGAKFNFLVTQYKVKLLNNESSRSS